MARKSVLVAASVLLLVGGLSARVPASRAGQSPDRSITLHVNEYPEVRLAEIASRADAVVVGRIDGARGFEVANSIQVMTDYRVVVEAVVKNAKVDSLAPGTVVTVRRVGGVIEKGDGRRVVVRENDFPAFVAGDRYVLFLARLTEPGVFNLEFGPQGAFRVGADGGVEQVSGLWKLEHRGSRVVLEALVDEVNAVVNR